MNSSLDQAEAFFWEWFPHETTWAELKEANPELWCKLQNLGQALVLGGRLSGKYLEDL